MESVDVFRLSILPPRTSGTAPVMRRTARPSAFALVQALIATGIIIVGGLASVQALILTNSKAASMRTLNNARAVVQRNIDTAMGVAFASTAVPTILAFTPTPAPTNSDMDTGVIYDETGGTASTVNIVTTRDGVGSVVSGRLYRTVRPEANGDSADIRRVTFRVYYNYRFRNYMVEMTTLRAPD